MIIFHQDLWNKWRKQQGLYTNSSVLLHWDRCHYIFSFFVVAIISIVFVVLFIDVIIVFFFFFIVNISMLFFFELFLWATFETDFGGGIL